MLNTIMQIVSYILLLNKLLAFIWLTSKTMSKSTYFTTKKVVN